MSWTPDQEIQNRARAISRNLIEIQWLLGRLLGDREVYLRKPRKLTRSELDRLQYLNERQLTQGLQLRKLLDQAETKR